MQVLGPTPDAQPEAASKASGRQCASSFEGRCGSSLTLMGSCALHCGGLFRVSAACWGGVGMDSRLSLGVKAGRHPAHPVKLSGQQADLPHEFPQDSQQPSGAWRASLQEVLPPAHTGRARSRALPEAAVPGSVWSLGSL